MKHYMNPDLTRWNRAGLKRFRYVDGNAVTYLEALRIELFERLNGWETELLGIGKIDDNDPKERETKRQKALEGYIEQFGKDHQRALDNYLELNDKRGGIALEIIRSFARAAHVLTEHLDAYANEGYLGTATQWENVRRLVHGLDYHPKPPASAMTYLVLQAKQKGLVSRGLQIRHTPEGESTVVFETLEDIQVDPIFNALRLKDWNLVPEKVTVSGGLPLILDGIVEGLKKNDPVIIESKQGLLPCLLKSAAIAGKNTVLNLELPGNKDLGARSDITVHLKPVETLDIYSNIKQQVLKADDSTLILIEKPAISSKEPLRYVFIGDNVIKGVYRGVSEVDVEGKKIKLASGKGIYGNSLTDKTLSAMSYYVGEPEILNKYVNPDTAKNPKLEDITGTQFILNFEGKADTITVLGDKTRLYDEKTKTGADILVEIKNVFHPRTVSGAELNKSELNKLENATIIKLTNNSDLGAITQIILPPSENQWKWGLDSFIDMSANSLKTGIVKRLEPGDLCAAVCGSNLVATRVKTVAKVTAEIDRFNLQVDSWQPANIAGQGNNFIHSGTSVFGRFKEQLRLAESNVNPEAVPAGPLILENAAAAASLMTGQPVLIEHEPSGQSFLTAVRPAAGGGVTLDSPLPAGYTTGGTVIRANVVEAGHGETQPEKILGSGDATQSNQEFLFPVPGVSFVSDAAQVSGVRADIRVIVDDETWTQVSRFNRSQPTDPHYTVRMTEEGQLRLVFGDGVNGRRLPTGENNIRIAWRHGSGTVGNLEAGLLKKPAQPHPRVEAVSQPFRCVGGNDMEPVTALRRSAPASLLTMERAVSVRDFAELAASHASVWSANAGLKSSGGDRVVSVTVVPAQGGALGESLSRTLEDYLSSNAIPGIHVELKRYTPEELELDITVAIDSERFDPDAVTAEVREVLLQNFSLRNRAIGAPVYLSDVYQHVEAVRGVEYSVCKFLNKDGVQFLYPEDISGGVLYMEDEKNVKLIWKEAEK